MTFEEMISTNKENIPEAAKALSADDLPRLVTLLNEQDDILRYPALLLLKCRSQSADDVYPFFDVFASKLKSDNSYQRSIGLMLMAENARWDRQGKLDAAINDFLRCVDDEKSITARQCIQALGQVVPYKKNLLGCIAQTLMQVDINALKPTMKKLILMDILHVLLQIRRQKPSNDLDAYIFEALSGGVLDDKSKKQISREINNFESLDFSRFS